MPNEISWRSLVSALSLAAVLLPAAIRFAEYTERRQDRVRLQQLYDFGTTAKVVEVYRYRSGNKTANFRHHTIAVLERSPGGRRLKIGVGDAAPVVGEVWELEYRPVENSIALMRKAEELGPASEITLPPERLEQFGAQHPVFATFAVLLIATPVPVLGIGSFLASLVSIFSFGPLCQAIFSFGRCDRDVKQLVRPAILIQALTVSGWSIASVAMNAGYFCQSIAALRRAYSIGFALGVLLLFLCLISCLRNS